MQLRTVMLILAFALLATTRPATAQSVTKQFTYQGFLENGGVPYTGNATFNFALYSQLSSPLGVGLRDQVTLTDVPVSKGVFSVVLNFGDTDAFNAPIYDGRALYLQIVANIGSNSVTLSPRQLIQPAPVALSLPNVTPNGANVGIGTATPGAKLHVTDSNPNLLALQGSSNFGSYLSLNNTSVGGENWAFISTGASNGEGAGKLLISDQSPRFMIDTNGNVGIGTITPERMLDVNGGGIVRGPVYVDGAFVTGDNVFTGGNLSVDGTAYVAGSTTVIGTIRYASDASPSAHTFDITSGSAIDLIGSSDIYMNSRGGRKHILINADAGAGNVGIGTVNPSEKLHVNGNIRAKVLIIEGGADLAESYDVASAGDIKPMPGMVVSIDPDRVGKLRIAAGAYDRTVAGIISGADGIAPGLVLGQKGTVADGEHPIANVGRVWCYVDADAGGPVVPGDLLTTSVTPGHAMKVSDHSISGGAILGKAMSRLESGKGLVLVLVTLQ